MCPKALFAVDNIHKSHKPILLTGKETNEVITYDFEVNCYVLELFCVQLRCH